MTLFDKDHGGDWHPGELELQRRIGVVEQMVRIGREHVLNYMPDQHRDFFTQLPYIVIGTVDDDNRPWVGVRYGEPGFITTPDSGHLLVSGRGSSDDPMEAGLIDGAGIAMLGIELHTRRRNRMNGKVKKRGDNQIQVVVGQSFGNCPQYIQLRRIESAQSTPDPAETLEKLDTRARSQIETADTFFVASYADRPQGRQVDVSHRGGRSGFVAIEEDGALTIPDFAGNHFFATLGNILLNGRAGLTFIDFSDGTMIQLSGHAEILEVDDSSGIFKGAERFWRFWPDTIIRRQHALPIRFEFKAWSPHVLATGSWQQATANSSTNQANTGWQWLRVTSVVDESSLIRSLYLSSDAAGLIRSKAGQHLPVRVMPEDGGPSLMRTYTISSIPSDEEYRISVKREGKVSTLLHSLVVGDSIETMPPAGQFVIDERVSRPAVLLAAGVGITPLLAMLGNIVHEGGGIGSIRPTWLFQAAHSKAERAFDKELADLKHRAGGAVQIMRVLSDPAGATAGDFDVIGRLDINLIKSCLALDDYDYYLCGPYPFMQSLYDALRDLNIDDHRIHAEAFGPATIMRRPERGASPAEPAAGRSVRVIFAASGISANWQSGSGTLLDLAEAEGLSPQTGCRSGSCGSCRVKLLNGSVTYTRPPEYTPEKGEVLLCQALPARATQQLEIDL